MTYEFWIMASITELVEYPDETCDECIPHPNFQAIAIKKNTISLNFFIGQSFLNPLHEIGINGQGLPSARNLDGRRFTVEVRQSVNRTEQ